MIIRAKQEGNVVICELEGNLDFETTVKFEETCIKMLNDGSGRRLVLNMEKLRFVGSSGINQFVKVLKGFNTLPVKPKLVRPSSEFEKIFRALETVRNPFDIFENENQAIIAFDTAPAPTVPSKRTRKKGMA